MAGGACAACALGATTRGVRRAAEGRCWWAVRPRIGARMLFLLVLEYAAGVQCLAACLVCQAYVDNLQRLMWVRLVRWV